MNTINKKDIINGLQTEYIGRDFYFFEKTTSTFDEADRISKKNGTVICAKVQTNGRGRLGRNWESGNGGIYFSVILKPQMSTDKLGLLTSLCATAVQRAILEYVPCSIKWPNDIVSENGKKLCGILTKLQSADEKTEYINVGIGINANTDCFDEELKYASSIKLLTGKEADENKLLCKCLLEIENIIGKENTNNVMEEYKKKCITLGKRVRLLYAGGDSVQKGLCLDVNPDGTLVVKKDDGTLVTVNSGEVSVRGIYGEEYV